MPAKHPLLVFQIQKQKRLDSALTVEGTRRTGGRWNQMDVPLIYASALPELAFLETFVHLDRTSLADLPPFVLLTLAVPTGALETVGPLTYRRAGVSDRIPTSPRSFYGPACRPMTRPWPFRSRPSFYPARLPVMR